MSVRLNHTIVWCRDKKASARFLAEILGLPPTEDASDRSSSLSSATASRSTSMSRTATIAPQHYAFLFSEDEFDEIFGRIRERRLDYWADPRRSAGEINHNDGGRGVYFEDPDGHFLEIITRPYGSGA